MAVTLDYALRLKTKEAENNARLTKAEVKKLKEELAQTKREAQQTERSMKQLGGSTGRLGRMAGRLGGSMGRVSGILGRLSPGLAEAAMVTSDLADATELASGGGASLFRVLGPVAVAVAAVGVAYLSLNAQLKEAKRLQEEAATAADDMAAIHLKVREAVLMRQLAEGDLSEEEFNRIASAKTAADVFKVRREEAQERVRQLNEERDALVASTEATKARAVANANAPLFSGDDLIGGGSAPVTVARVDSKHNAVEAKNAIKSLNEEILQQETRAAAAATALDVLAKAEARLVDELTRTKNASSGGGGDEGKPSLPDITGTLGDLGKMTDQLEAVDAAVGEAFDPDDINAWGDALVASIEKAAQAQMRLEGIQKAGSVLGTGGDPLALLSLAGPGGAAVGAGLGGLASLGGKDDEELDAMFSGLGEDIIAGVAKLPLVIVEHLPDLAIMLVTQLPPALAKAIAQALRALLDRILPGREKRRDRRQARRAARGDGDGFLNRVGDLLGGDFERRKGRSSGGTIPRDGMYLLHKGEEILRSTGLGSGNGQAAAQQIMLHLRMHTPGMLPTIQQMSIMTGPGGLYEEAG